MRWCATRPMTVCCCRAGGNGMSASPARSKNASPNWRRTSRNCWPIISARRGWRAPACDYRMRAGDRAVSRSAYQGGDRAFLGGSQDGRNIAGRRGPHAPPTGFSAETRPGVDGLRAACRAPRSRTPIAAAPRSAKISATAQHCTKPNGACGLTPMLGARQRWRATARTNW